MAKAKLKYKHSFSCVDVPCANSTLDELMSLIERIREISLATFKRNVGASVIEDIRQAYGYVMPRKQGCALERDYHVRFGSVMHRGKLCYVMVHSAIEHVYSPC